MTGKKLKMTKGTLDVPYIDNNVVKFIVFSNSFMDFREDIINLIFVQKKITNHQIKNTCRN